MLPGAPRPARWIEKGVWKRASQTEQQHCYRHPYFWLMGLLRMVIKLSPAGLESGVIEHEFNF